MKTVTFLACFLFLQASITCQRTCTVVVPTLGRKEPLFLTTRNTFNIPLFGRFVLENNEMLRVFCTSDQIQKDVTCVGGQFMQNGRPFDLQNFQCENENEVDVKQQGEGCPQSSLKYEIGFNLSQNAFLPYISVCYNPNTASTLYAEHNVHGQSVGSGDKMLPINTPTWRKDIIQQFDIEKAYEKSSQLTRFVALLGSEALARRYINPQNGSEYYFAKGHLAPDAEGIFVSWRRATYFYLNTVPQWQFINNRNWGRLEDEVRHFATLNVATIKVRTGGVGTLNLENRDILLGEWQGSPKLNVPLWNYKKLYNATSNDGIVAFYTLNNPYATQLPQPLPCVDVCANIEWLTRSFQDSRKSFQQGYTICCTLS